MLVREVHDDRRSDAGKEMAELPRGQAGEQDVDIEGDHVLAREQLTRAAPGKIGMQFGHASPGAPRGARRDDVYDGMPREQAKQLAACISRCSQNRCRVPHQLSIYTFLHEYSLTS
jgi:hypothetical protein